ncbi:MAG: tetratricopeptide repeat protein [Bacteroidales bacterium]|nr:tetratricopeptide repeat protein [Candidatus Sodaliphilus aphodohippi]
MAQRKNEPVRTKLEEVNESLTSTAQKLEENKKYIYWVVGAIMAVVVLAGGYYYGIYKPNEAKAKDQIGQADIEYLMQDTAKALKDYEKVCDEFSNKPAERAAFNAAIILYQQGKYKEAAKYLEDYDAAGNVVGPAAKSLLGDCYVNQKMYDKAISAFDAAIKMADKNQLYAPTFMMKKATVLHAQKKYADEAAIYQDIKDNYIQYTQNYQVNIDKYLERALALSGK